MEALRRHGGLKHLHLSCFWGRPEQVEELIRLGADVNEPDEHGRTPRAIALAKVADPETRDPAERARYTAIAELLRQHGAAESGVESEK